MGIVIQDDIVHAAHMSEDEIKQELAVLLFQKDRLTLGQASKLAGMSQIQFQHLLASRKIPVHYDIAEFESDLKTLHAMGCIMEAKQKRLLNSVKPILDSLIATAGFWITKELYYHILNVSGEQP